MATPTNPAQGTALEVFWNTNQTVSLATGSDATQVDDAAFTPATSRVLMVGFTADESSTDSVDEGDGGAPRMTLDRKVIASLYPHTAGGLSVYRNIDLDENGVNPKASAGQVYGYVVSNRDTANVMYLKIYDKATAPTQADTPIMTIPLPTGVSTGQFALPYGIACSNGIGLRATTGLADNDVGGPDANDVVCNLLFK